MVHLDTHTAIWISEGRRETLPERSRKLLRTYRPMISPMVQLELAFLHQVGRIAKTPAQIIEKLRRYSDLGIAESHFDRVAAIAAGLDYTRDPVRPPDRRPRARGRCAPAHPRPDPAGALSRRRVGLTRSFGRLRPDGIARMDWEVPMFRRARMVAACVVLFVDRLQHLDDRALDEFVLQRRHPEGPLATVRLRDHHPSHGTGPEGAPCDACRQILEVGLQVLAVRSPRHAVDAGRGAPPEGEVRRPQAVHVVDMVQERGEPLLLVFPCCFSHAVEPTGRRCPALRQDGVGFARVPLGQGPSLHPLRGRLSGVVRGLLRYYDPVRLLAIVHHRRAPLGFPMRAAAAGADAVNREISRFPCGKVLRVRGVSDRAGSGRSLRWRTSRCGLPPTSTASAPRSETWISRLNTQPAHAPVNASPTSSRTPAHDSGSAWFATPSLSDSFILSFPPV
jgi:PIN domain nuclease of toxin-antitoxin system